MVDRESGGNPGAAGPGPDGAGYTYHPVERELVVVARPEIRLRADGRNVRSEAGADTSRLTAFLTEHEITLEPLFGASENRLQAALAALPVPPEPQAPDLSLFYRVRGAELREEELVGGLAGLPELSGAYAKQSALPAAAPAPSMTGTDGDSRSTSRATPSFLERQGYLGHAPEGLGITSMWQQPGGGGQGVLAVDIGGAWQYDHECLAARQPGLLAGTPVKDADWRNHGTSMLGVVGADRSRSGVVGIAPDVVMACVSIGGLGTARAILTAADRLDPGSLLQIGLQRPGPRHSFNERDDQKGYIPLEWWPDDFAAIRYATDRGILVVAAAGNGDENLDDARYDQAPAGFPDSWRNPFDPTNPGSGAVLVGAGAPPPGTHGRDHGPDRSRLGFSNYGSRVDAQAWGNEVTTAGGSWEHPGELQGGLEETTWYTDAFSGSSAATAQVTGALAVIQGVLGAALLPLLRPEQARALLRATGSPQQDAPGRPSAQRIGSRPDVQAAVAHLVPASVGSGTARRLWDELLPYPHDKSPRLRLFVDGAWRSLDTPDPEVRRSVQAAFAATGIDVRVWYSGDEVLGLVITAG